MGRSNRTAALESKIMFLMGEHETKLLEIAKAENCTPTAYHYSVNA